MKKLGLIFLSILACSEIYSLSLSASLDLAALDSLFLKENRVAFELEADHGDFIASFPFCYAFKLDEEVSLLDLSLKIKIRPFDNLGLYFGADVFSYMRYFGIGSPGKRDLFIPAFYAGWRYRYSSFLVDVAVCVNDPARLDPTSTERLKKDFFYLNDVYFTLMMGVEFDVFEGGKDEKLQNGFFERGSGLSLDRTYDDSTVPDLLPDGAFRPALP